MTAYYNEIDPFAAAWLRELIKAGVIAPGDVDERSIEDVDAADLRPYTQCHFFAGIGVWSYALRQSGWPDDRPVWTGSCPCQGFSVAGKQKGFEDERHLWPVWEKLISAVRPPVIFGEQVASKLIVGRSSSEREAADWHAGKINGDSQTTWFDLVQADLEKAGYASAPFDLPAAGFGSPNIRQRLLFAGIDVRTGNSIGTGLEGYAGHGDSETGRSGQVGSAAETGSSGGVADDAGQRCQRGRSGEAGDGRDPARLESERLCDAGGLGNTHSNGCCEGRESDAEAGLCGPAGNDTAERVGHSGGISTGRDAGTITTTEGEPEVRADGDDSGSSGFVSGAKPAGPVNGLWADSDWLLCRDGKFRPVRPGTFPLVDGAPARVGRLRGYGNAINAEVAIEFIKAGMAVIEEVA